MRSRNGTVTALVAVLVVATAFVGSACVQPRPPWWAPSTTPPAAGHRQVAYGPFVAPATFGNVMGMTGNQYVFNVAKPCTNCYITGMRAGLTTVDGRPANADTGSWLHHMALANSSATGLACAITLGGERFYSAGNERTPIDLTRSGDYGYPVRATDSWTLLYDLMNMSASIRTFFITVDFDYVPLSTPGFRAARPLRLDVAPCNRDSEVPAQHGRYQHDGEWTVTLPAKLLYFHGHLHDGGTNMTLTHDGRQVCDSVQRYGERPEYVEGPGLPMPGMSHLSSASACQGTTAEPLAHLAVGDRLSITAHYDAEAHMQMGDEGVMGVAHLWLDAGNA